MDPDGGGPLQPGKRADPRQDFDVALVDYEGATLQPFDADALNSRVLHLYRAHTTRRFATSMPRWSLTLQTRR
jgi:hypothetical protein